MTNSQIITALRSIKKWKKKDERAPHKPLLLLIYLARLSNGNLDPLSFSDAEDILIELLQKFGPSRASYHPEQPFARLTNDGIWVLDQSIDTKNVSISELRIVNPSGKLTKEIQDALTKDSSLLTESIQILLDENFPDSIHEEIKSAIGLCRQTQHTTRAIRDPKFREDVLLAYNYSCAVCGFNLRIKNVLAAVEAAHIKWHAMNGPNSVSNGIALCTMHHKLFDLGAMGIDSDIKVMVSPKIEGSGKELWLTKFAGKEIRTHTKRYSLPSERFLGWHESEVFKA